MSISEKELEELRSARRQLRDKLHLDVERSSTAAYEAAGHLPAVDQDEHATRRQTFYSKVATFFRDRENEKGPNGSLSVDYSEREFRTKKGACKESTAAAILRHDDVKANIRRDAALAKLDQDARRNLERPGRYDATHLIAAMFGAHPDERNLVAFNSLMNRGEMAAWERETRSIQTGDNSTPGSDMYVKVTAQYKLDESGRRPEIPYAIRLERVNLSTGKADILHLGNFSSRKIVAAADPLATKAQWKAAEAADYQRQRSNRMPRKG